MMRKKSTAKKKTTKKKSRKSKVQFCSQTLKFYLAKDGERDYSIHERTLQEKVDRDNAQGNERREDAEIRLIKCLVGKTTVMKVTVYSEPKWVQQVLRDFPVLIQKIHHIQLSGAESGNLKEISKTVLDEFFNKTTSFLIETSNEKHSKLVVKLTEIYQRLEWRKVRRTSQSSTKEDILLKS